MLKDVKCYTESLLFIHLFTAKWKLYDYFFYFVLIPLCLLFIFKLPTNLKDAYFILNPSKITFGSIFLSNYVHSSFQHISGNIFSYLVACFLIFNFETKKRDFYAYSMFMFLVLPLIISIVSLKMIGLQTTYQGFSGIVSFLFGYLLYVLYKYLKTYYCKNLNITFLYLLVVMNLFMILENLQSGFFLYVLLLTIILYLTYLQKEVIIEINQKKSIILSSLKKLSSFQKSYVCLLFPLTIVFSFVLPSLVPQNIIHDGSITNSLAHYAGYFFGVFIPLIPPAISSILYNENRIVH